MLKHYLTTSVRYLLRHKTYSGINLIGLSIGIASAIMLALYVFDEFSFDRFHENRSRIFRLTQKHSEPGRQTNLPYVSPATAPALADEFPSIEQTVQFGITAPVMLGYKDQYIVPNGTETYYASPNVFEIFTFPLEAGHPSTALSEPYSIVLTESLANRFFGDSDPMDQVLTFQVHGQERQGLKVKGVLNDVPANSHLDFECLVSFATLQSIYQGNPSWEEQNIATYLLLNKEGAAPQLEKQLTGFMEKQGGEKAVAQSSLHLQPLSEIHLHSSHLDSDRAKRGNRQLVLLLLAIAIGIVGIASINFMNLTTARSSERMQEIGVRKTLGAERQQLICQFLGESVLITLVSLGVGLLLLELALPGFNAFTGKELQIDYGKSWHLLLGFAAVLGLLSGAYPAVYLSVFRPVDVIKGRLGTGRSGVGLRKILVVAQFAIATLLFIATGVVWQQLKFIQQKDLGFQKEQVLYTVIPSNRSSGNELFKQELLQHPNIHYVGRAVVRPLYDMNTDFPSTPTLAEVGTEMVQPEMALRKIEVGYDYLEAFDMRLLAGRSFSPHISSDATGAFILNETAIKAIGWADPVDALGQSLHYDGREGTVIGVLEDYHFEGLHSRILPFVMVYNKFSPMVFVKLDPYNVAGSVAHVQRTWEKHSTSKEPFHYDFMDELYAAHYAQESRLQTILSCFAILAVFLTCLGVLGLTAFTAEQRKKEIGIRKVLGSSVGRLVGLLSKEMLGLFLAANLIAWPLAYYLMDQWLQHFAYHEALGISSFIGAMGLVGVITFGAVGWLSVRAALANPVEVLGRE
ncbi:MAG: ABC transporter permease [Bacteroidota bacterium]